MTAVAAVGQAVARSGRGSKAPGIGADGRKFMD